MQLAEQSSPDAYAVITLYRWRFLKFADFLHAEVNVWLDVLRKLSPKQVVSPRTANLGIGFDLNAIDALCPTASWEARLRIHHALGKLYLEHDAPSCVYASFHIGLLLNDYNYDEFTRAWVVETLENIGNRELTEPIKSSPDHIILGSSGYIFRTTPFVLARLALLAEENNRRREAASESIPLASALPAEENDRRAEASKRAANQHAETLRQFDENMKRAFEEARQRDADAVLIAKRDADAVLTSKLRAAERSALRATEKAARRRRLSEHRNSFEPYYVITLAPGLVKYLEVAHFLETDARHWIDLIRGMSPQPRIQPPSRLSIIDKLLPNLSWEDRLLAHHALGRLSREQGVSLSVYCSFHSHLKLTALALDAFLNAWVREASGNTDLMESFLGAQDYLVFRDASPYGENCVFRKTPFVIERLTEIERVAQLDAKKQLEENAALKESADLDRLLKSNFNTFLYVMEDLRNGYFKIGRSRSPGKRERTLQSEVPQIVLRFSIPADEEHERELHDHFANKRLRGEWFSLAPDDLQWLVSFLKRNGDVARASIDYQWLGTIAFNVRDNPSAR